MGGRPSPMAGALVVVTVGDLVDGAGMVRGREVGAAVGTGVVGLRPLKLPPSLGIHQGCGVGAPVLGRAVVGEVVDGRGLGAPAGAFEVGRMLGGVVGGAVGGSV